MRILAFCLMPNHFHLCLQPFEDGDLSEFMKWLMTTHVSQFRKSHPGSGHVWQGRYRAFAAQENGHLVNVLRYIERNAVRAGLAEYAEQWAWCSAATQSMIELSEWPIPKPMNWLESLRVAEDAEELARLRMSVNQGLHYGSREWLSEQAALR